MESHLEDILPIEGENPSSYAERIGNLYAKFSAQKDKKNKGQFFTPIQIASFMGALSDLPSAVAVRILDPGCGCGILSCTIVEKISINGNIDNIILDAYETDIRVLPLLEKVFVYLQNWCRIKKGINLSYNIISQDFILTNYHYLSNDTSLFSNDKDCVRYDYIISNPPYFKLSNNDLRVKVCNSIIDGQANIYSLFMAICSRMLSANGQMIFITPRSFTSGKYFQSFRHFLFLNVSVSFIHLFNTRKDTFGKDNVLQELVIFKFSAGRKNASIKISYSESIEGLANPTVKEYRTTDIIDTNTSEHIIYLPTSVIEERIISLFKSWDGNFEKYGIKISTGPVVAFRLKEYITSTNAQDTVPLYWLQNVIKMLSDHPVERKEKGQYIIVCPETKSALLPNKNYIFIRRFSSKDDESRLVAAPYFGNMLKYQQVGVENKLNYVYRPKGRLRRDEVIGIAALLNSKLFDTYFRTFNGNINVSASELKVMPLPPLEVIRELGKIIILQNNYSVEYINELVTKYFNVI